MSGLPKMNGCENMNTALLVGSIVGGVALAGSTVSYGVASTLFKRVVPRQDMVNVDLSEMADMQKWEEYKNLIIPRKEWLMQQPLEKVSVTARDGVVLRAHYLPAEKPSDRLVIGCHGYSSCGLNDFSAHTYFFHQMGFDCLIPDHRAHGESDGTYIGFGILDRFDCRKWIDYVEKRFHGKKRILLHGTSMGGATVLMTSAMPNLPKSVKGIISDCAFTSPYDVFAHILKRDYHLPPFPVMYLSNHICRKKAGYGFRDYSTLTAVQQTSLPILFIHGAEDNFVPTWMSRKNYELCRAPKELLIVEHAGHGASYYENMPQYEAAESSFIQQWIPQQAEGKEEV